MSQLHRVLCGAALIALIPISACSSNGRVGYSGNLGGSASGGGGTGQPGGSGGSQGDGSGGTLAQAVDDTSGTVLAAAGNLTGGGLPEDGADAGAAADPLGRVTVGDDTVVGQQGSAQPTAIGLSVNADSQEQGQLATLGVLNNGQVVAANDVGDSGSDLIGAHVDGEQVVGESGQQQIGLGVLAPANTEGAIGDVNALTGNQIVDVELNNNTEGAGAGSLTDGLQGLLGQD